MATGTSIGRLFWQTGVDFSGFRRDSQRAQSSLSGLFKPSIIGATAVTTALVSAGKAALDFSREFETAFAEVQTISATARDNADEMRESILRMTTEIPVGAVDSTRALYQIVSAGFDGSDAMNVLEISAKAAVAGVTDTATAADTLTTIINAYGLSANEATNISDALFKTVELGKTTLSEIGSSFSQVASIAASYNIKQNDILAGLASITKQGGSTGEAVTRLRSAIVSLAKEFGPAIFQGKTLGEAFEFARQKADASGKTYEEFFGRVEASTGILQLTGKNAVLFADSLDKINGSAGSTENALAVMNKTLGAQEKLLENNIAVLKDQFGSVLKELWLTVLPGLNNDLKTLADDSIPGYAKAMAALVSAINIPAMFGGTQFTPLDFSPEIVNMRKFAEAETEEFLKNTGELSDEEFKKEVERQQQLKEVISNNIADLNDRKEKGYQYDEDALKEFQKQNLALYHILEASEERLAKTRKETPAPGTGSETTTTKARTYGDIEQDIKDVQAAIKTATKDEIGQFSIRLTALEKEKDVWKEIAYWAEQSVSGISGGKLPTKGAKQFDTENIKIAVLDLKKVNKQLAEGKLKAEKMAEAMSFEAKAMLFSDQLSNASASLSDVSDLIGKIDSGLGESVEQAAQFAAAAANIATGLATGNVFQVIGGAASAASALITEQDISDTQRYEKAVTALEKAYANLSRQISLALGEEKITSREEAIENIRAQIDATNDLINAELESVKVTKIFGIPIRKQRNADLKAVEEYKDKIEDLNDEIEDILKETTELITGTTGEDLASAFVDAFEVGEDAAVEFGDVLNDVITDSVKNALARKFLEQPLQEAINDLSEDIESGSELTKEEANKFKDTATSIGEAYASALEQASAALGVSFAGDSSATATGLAGSIRSELTEETGSIISGVLRRGLDESIRQSDILTESNEIQQEIAANTLRTAIACESLDSKMSINQDNRDLGV